MIRYDGDGDDGSSGVGETKRMQDSDAVVVGCAQILVRHCTRILNSLWTILLMHRWNNNIVRRHSF